MVAFVVRRACVAGKQSGDLAILGADLRSFLHNRLTENQIKRITRWTFSKRLFHLCGGFFHLRYPWLRKQKAITFQHHFIRLPTNASAIRKHLFPRPLFARRPYCIVLLYNSFNFQAAWFFAKYQRQRIEALKKPSTACCHRRKRY